MKKFIRNLINLFSTKEVPRQNHNYNYVLDLVWKAKKRELELGNNPTKLTISPDLMIHLETIPEFLPQFLSGKHRIFGLDVNIDYDKELYISVD